MYFTSGKVLSLDNLLTFFANPSICQDHRKNKQTYDKNLHDGDEHESYVAQKLGDTTKASSTNVLFLPCDRQC